MKWKHFFQKANEEYFHVAFFVSLIFLWLLVSKRVTDGTDLSISKENVNIEDWSAPPTFPEETF